MLDPFFVVLKTSRAIRCSLRSAGFSVPVSSQLTLTLFHASTVVGSQENPDVAEVLLPQISHSLQRSVLPVKRVSVGCVGSSARVGAVSTELGMTQPYRRVSCTASSAMRSLVGCELGPSWSCVPGVKKKGKSVPIAGILWPHTHWGCYRNVARRLVKPGCGNFPCASTAWPGGICPLLCHFPKVVCLFLFPCSAAPSC